MTTHTVENLKTHINAMDMFSHSAFTKIKAIAKLARHALETPNGVNDLQSLGYALETIESAADMCMNDINFEAEKSGQNYCDDAARLRFSAQCNAQRSIEKKAVARALAGRV